MNVSWTKLSSSCRFYLGSQAAKIVSQNKVQLKQWNTIQVERKRKRGILTLNNQTIEGESKGSLSSLDVQGVISIGGLKDKTE